MDHDKLTASDGQPGDLFGSSVASCGKVVVIGAPQGSKGDVKTGAAYVFHMDSKAQVLKLTAADGVSGGSFGFRVTIYGNIIMVSTQNDNGGVYTFDAINGFQLQKFINPSTSSSTFGSSLAIHISTNVAIVGDHRAGSYAGAVYIYNLSTGDLVRQITPAGTGYQLFGISLCVSDDFLLVGAPYDSADNGTVYVFDVYANWMEMTVFGPTDYENGGNFGLVMASSGPQFIITANNHDDPIDDDMWENGAVYIGKAAAGTKYSKFAPTRERMFYKLFFLIPHMYKLPQERRGKTLVIT